MPARAGAVEAWSPAPAAAPALAGAALARADRPGLAPWPGPRALRDITLARDAGRFTVGDPVASFVIVGGAAMTLSHVVLTDPTYDDAALTDQVTEDLLRTLGLTAADAADVCRRELPDVQRLLADVRARLGGPDT